MDVIEIPSSPELAPDLAPNEVSPSRSRRNPRRSQRLPFVPTGDVIEIPDSDEDEKVALRSRKRARPPQAQAGSSRLESSGALRDIAAPVANLPPWDESSPLRHISRPNTTFTPSSQNTKILKLPLFLPSDEENDPPQPQEPVEPAPDAPAEPRQPSPEFQPPAAPAVPLPASRPPSPDVNPADTYLARILEVIPDVQPAHALSLVEQHLPQYQESVVAAVLHILFETPSYPKIDKKGKRKREEDDPGEGEQRMSKAKVDYGNKNRPFTGGLDYVNIALEQLLLDFPYIPKPYVRKTLLAHNGLYAPAYLSLHEEQRSGNTHYKKKMEPSRVTGKDKATHDPEFESEREWLLEKLQEDAAKNDQAVAEELNEQEYEECGDGIECGCCFSNYPFDKMIQCPDAHLFCNSCMTSYASTLLGEHDPKIVCMDQSGCKLSFSESELRRFLTPKLMALYDRVKQRKEIEAAGLEGLEECPFCEYKVVIENPDEKLFRCENSECEAITCRQCKKLDHLPKSCKEMEDNKHLDVRHKIEEAMTRALMRNCPKCQNAFIKEHGCNKMMCPNCRTISCYVCRQVIQGYDHFGNPPPYTGQADPNKCQLWDSVEKRHADEVTEAAKKALEEFKRQHPDIDEADIKVDLPPPVAAPPPPAVLGAGPAYGMFPPPYVAVPRIPQGWDAQQQQIRAQFEEVRNHALAAAQRERVRARGPQVHVPFRQQPGLMWVDIPPAVNPVMLHMGPGPGPMPMPMHLPPPMPMRKQPDRRRR